MKTAAQKEDSMRPLPWTVRVGLFAVGFGVGLSHYRAPSTQQPILIELRVVNPEVTPAADEHILPFESPCIPPASNLKSVFFKDLMGV